MVTQRRIWTIVSSLYMLNVRYMHGATNTGAIGEASRVGAGTWGAAGIIRIGHWWAISVSTDGP